MNSSYEIESYQFNGVYYDSLFHEATSLASLLEIVEQLKSRHSLFCPEAGFSIQVHHPSGPILQIGISETGWVLITDPGLRIDIVSLGEDNTGETAFLLPEWTEFRNKYVLPADFAKALVREWLSTGVIAHPHT